MLPTAECSACPQPPFFKRSTLSPNSQSSQSDLLDPKHSKDTIFCELEYRYRRGRPGPLSPTIARRNESLLTNRWRGLDSKFQFRCGTFRYKDYRRNGQAPYRTKTLSAGEFIKRFLLHVLPKGFHRIRHYGLLANIARAKELMATPMPEGAPPASHDTVDPDAITDCRPPCPWCRGRMIIVEVFARGAAPRSPPSGAGIRN